MGVSIHGKLAGIGVLNAKGTVFGKVNISSCFVNILISICFEHTSYFIDLRPSHLGAVEYTDWIVAKE